MARSLLVIIFQDSRGGDDKDGKFCESFDYIRTCGIQFRDFELLLKLDTWDLIAMEGSYEGYDDEFETEDSNRALNGAVRTRLTICKRGH